VGRVSAWGVGNKIYRKKVYRKKVHEIRANGKKSYRKKGLPEKRATGYKVYRNKVYRKMVYRKKSYRNKIYTPMSTFTSPYCGVLTLLLYSLSVIPTYLETAVCIIPIWARGPPPPAHCPPGTVPDLG
jgi:hypothetical protein